MTTFETLKNRLTNGHPYDLDAARARIAALANTLDITQAQADELYALAEAHAAAPDQAARIAALEGKIDMLDKIGMRTERKPSERPGEDIISYYMGDVLMRSEYVPAENPEGTAENPIAWTIDTILHPNFYYIHEDVRKVWTGEDGVTAAWDDTGWEVW